MQMFSVIIVYLHQVKVNNFKPYYSLFKPYKIPHITTAYSSLFVRYRCARLELHHNQISNYLYLVIFLWYTHLLRLQSSFIIFYFINLNYKFSKSSINIPTGTCYKTSALRGKKCGYICNFFRFSIAWYK